MRDYSLYSRFELPERSRAVIERWTEELRTTKLNQGSNYLYNVDDDNFCAIGVLMSEVYAMPVNKLEKRDFPVLVHPLQKAKEPLFQYVGGLNDGGNPFKQGDGYAQLSFSEIADFLESNVDFKN